jgi:hypothetical protein
MAEDFSLLINYELNERIRAAEDIIKSNDHFSNKTGYVVH